MICEIEISETDIFRHVFCYSDDCPVARGFYKVVARPTKVSVAKDSVLFWLGDESFRVPLPPEVQRFIRNFDILKQFVENPPKCEPFSFQIDLPKEILP